MKKFDLIVIGGGAAGIMAAITAAKKHPDKKIALLDRTFALGRKILVCGAGRCNITNINLDKDQEHRYYGAESNFVKSIFEQFSYKQIVEFFNELGVELYVERKTNVGKLFPVTDQAKTITALLEDELQRLGVDTFLNTEVTNVSYINQFNLETKAVTEHGTTATFISEYLIISAGGKTYPALGANGSGYDLAKSLGHKIIEPVPSALPLEGKNPLSQQLQGTKMDIEITSVIDGEKIKTSTDDVMFTQYGISGPAVLNISREISIHFNRQHKNNAHVLLNFFPGKNAADLAEFLQARWQKRPDQTLEKSLYGLFPTKIPPVLLQIIGLNPALAVSELSEAQLEMLCNKLTSYKIIITGTRGWNEAEFTAGGVDSHDIKPGTLESQHLPKLYFCGEILDVDGDVGGFNLSWAWASGYVAGLLR